MCINLYRVLVCDLILYSKEIAEKFNKPKQLKVIDEGVCLMTIHMQRQLEVTGKWTPQTSTQLSPQDRKTFLLLERTRASGHRMRNMGPPESHGTFSAVSGFGKSAGAS